MTVVTFNGWSESDQKAIREQLDRILNSGPFHQAPRRQRFLEYIVNEALAGRGKRLKGYNVALAVFDRAETFDPNIDPIVRSEAARLRDRLREYYETRRPKGSNSHRSTEGHLQTANRVWAPGQTWSFDASTNRDN